MIILAVDTSTRTCGIGVSDGDQSICELYLTSGQTHSRHLMDTITRSLDASNMALGEVDGFAAVRGPGSFTGLRIGISTVKGLAYATGIPMVGISSLEALARSVIGETAPRVCSVVDARKNEVYHAIYRLEEGGLVEETPPCVGPPDAIPESDEQTLFVGDGALLYQAVIRHGHGTRAAFAPPELNGIRVSTVARLAFDRFGNGDVDPIESMAPFYIRKSDAELAREGKLG